MRKSIICLYCFYFMFISCKMGSVIIYENSNFTKSELEKFQVDDDMYITADIKYTGENYGIVFHVYSSRDLFKNLTVKSLKLNDEKGDLLVEENFINIIIDGEKSFFDSVNDLYERTFLLSDCYLTRQEIQTKKAFYNLEYYVGGRKKIEKLIRNEDRYLFSEP